MAWTSSPSHFWRFPSFARGAVPSYSSRSQNTKFISLSQSLTFLFVLFYANGKATFALNKSPSIDKSSVAF